MSAIERSGERRAARLLRCYPASWRERYGDEFTELLLDDISERPRSFSRTANVIGSGMLARFTAAGLTGEALDTEGQVRASLVALGCAITAFMAFGLAVWSQLAIGWQWSAPQSTSIRSAMVMMTFVLPVLALLALLAVIPVAWTLLATLVGRRGDRRPLIVPVLLLVAGGAVLIAGGIYFDHGWPGTGGHPWGEQGLVPATVARFFWALTVSITSYWAHPGALKTFPAIEVAWMAASPLALVAALVGAVKTLRCVSLPGRTLRYEIWLGTAAAGALAVFLAGACCWIVVGSPAPHRLFTIGFIDIVGLGVMAIALISAFRAVERALGVLKHQPVS